MRAGARGAQPLGPVGLHASQAAQNGGAAATSLELLEHALDPAAKRGLVQERLGRVLYL